MYYADGAVCAEETIDSSLFGVVPIVWIVTANLDRERDKNDVEVKKSFNKVDSCFWESSFLVAGAIRKELERDESFKRE